MSDPVKAALIIAAAIVGGVAIWTYFSPYHSCVRMDGRSNAPILCAAALGGGLPRR